MTSNVKEFFQKHEVKIVTFAGFLLVSAISFQAGALWGQKWQQKPLIVEKHVEVPIDQEKSENGLSGASGSVAGNQASGAVTKTEILKTPTASVENCAYVGSRNSDKFYLPTCSWAKRIKPENLVCYKSEQEGLARGKKKSDCQ